MLTSLPLLLVLCFIRAQIPHSELGTRPNDQFDVAVLTRWMALTFLKVHSPFGARYVIRAAVLMLLIFILLLSYLYFDSPTASRPGTSILPSANDKSNSGVTTGGPHVEFVVASMKQDDTSWFKKYIPRWKANVYIVDDPKAALTVPQNKGREAMVYLT